ncbi:hypothetical protein LMG27174_05482 [Paraburkholderia rhynchosiae]|uniref:Uncharacterized protein n=1 Tax=Paraburkholderia rhynchosiae TaxID=487049 RepID=A0A6J5C665_9BURK|nr:hypothetical protein LMG27174_05482 [Paraburkholderia rhynchosiae]
MSRFALNTTRLRQVAVGKAWASGSDELALQRFRDAFSV